MRFACTPLFVCLLIVPLAHAQSSSALINQALDKQATIDVSTVLPQAMKQISDQTGVPLRADPSVWDVLPWGEQTNVTAKIANTTLREALQALTPKLGLTFVLRDEYVELQPMPALTRLGRRSTVQELQALDLLTSTPAGLSTDHPTLKQLVETVDQKLVDLKAPFAIENRTPAALQDQPVTVPRNASLAEALESIPTDTAATWYPWGKSLVILAKADQVRALLSSKTISTRYNGVDVSQVLLELSKLAGVPFSIEPGALQRIPPEFRNVRTMILDNAPIQQVLDNLAGSTGLAWAVNEKGVYVYNQSNPGAAGNANPGNTTTPRDPAVGLVPLDNGMQYILTESQLPPDVRDYLHHKTQKWIDNVRTMMKDENYHPATQPAPTTTKETNQDL